jgi:hypothetical protein
MKNLFSYSLQNDILLDKSEIDKNFVLNLLNSLLSIVSSFNSGCPATKKNIN